MNNKPNAKPASKAELSIDDRVFMLKFWVQALLSGGAMVTFIGAFFVSLFSPKVAAILPPPTSLFAISGLVSLWANSPSSKKEGSTNSNIALPGSIVSQSVNPDN